MILIYYKNHVTSHLFNCVSCLPFVISCPEKLRTSWITIENPHNSLMCSFRVANLWHWVFGVFGVFPEFCPKFLGTKNRCFTPGHPSRFPFSVHGIPRNSLEIATTWQSLIFFKWTTCINARLGGGFKYFLFSPLFGEDSHFD